MAHVGQELGFGLGSGLGGALGFHQGQLLAFAFVDVQHQAGQLFRHAVLIQVHDGPAVDPARLAGRKQQPPFQLRHWLAVLL